MNQLTSSNQPSDDADPFASDDDDEETDKNEAYVDVGVESSGESGDDDDMENLCY